MLDKVINKIKRALYRDYSLFHITHPKAGSQWIHRILILTFHDKIIPTKLKADHFLGDEILPGRVYPALYITLEQFNSVKLPKRWKRIVVIRDLRDTLISTYFSLKVSHPVISENISNNRAILNNFDTTEEGLIYLINNWKVTPIIQKSWVDSGEDLIHYEDLLERDIALLKPLIYRGFPVSKKRFEDAVVSNRFENYTNGRKRGDEDINAHERKAMPGDWKNYFSERVKKEFKSKYGDLLIKSGYENNNNW